MEQMAFRFQSRLVNVFALLCVGGQLVSGCKNENDSQAQPNWLPMVVGGPQEIRPIPPAKRVVEDYKQWVQSDPSLKVRLYSITLFGATNQINLVYSSTRGDTPLGAKTASTASFVFRHSTNGDYLLKWSCRSPDETNRLKLGDAPRRALLQPLEVIKESNIPVLRIVALEGIEARASVVADRGEHILLE